MNQSPATEPARILVVDDLEHNLELFRTVLTRAGYVVETAGNGRAAVHAVRTSAFDVVLMDVNMPVMDGLAATREIRSLGPPSCDVTIVGMSANVFPDQLRAFEEAGMDDYLGKPFRRAQLLAKVAAWVEWESPSRGQGPGASENGAIANRAEGREAADERGLSATSAGPDQTEGQDECVSPWELDDLEALMGVDWIVTGLARLRDQIEETFSGDVPSDHRLLARQAHALVSQAALLTFRSLSSACSTLEEACLRGGATVLPAYHRARTLAVSASREIERLSARWADRGT